MKIFVIFFLFLAVCGYAQAPRKTLRHAKDAISAAHQAHNDVEKHAAYAQIDIDSVQDDADVKALYDELDSIHNGFKVDDQIQERIRDSKVLSDVLAKCQQPAHHGVITQLLEHEYSNMPANYAGPWGAKSSAEESKESLRFERLNSLTIAAGKGKNESALPALRKLRKKGGVAGKVAEEAIAQIGADQDFEQFYQDSLNDPRARVDLSPFGPKVLDRVLRDINDPAFPSTKKRRIIGHLPRITDKTLIPRYMGLLSNQNPEVVSIAARRLAEASGLLDDATIMALLSNSNPSVRDPALRAVGRMHGSFADSILIKTLAHDRDENQRAYAAIALGSRPSSDAVSALQLAIKSDPSKAVKDSAAAALERVKSNPNH